MEALVRAAKRVHMAVVLTTVVAVYTGIRVWTLPLPVAELKAELEELRTRVDRASNRGTLLAILRPDWLGAKSAELSSAILDINWPEGSIVGTLDGVVEKDQDFRLVTLDSLLARHVAGHKVDVRYLRPTSATTESFIVHCITPLRDDKEGLRVLGVVDPFDDVATLDAPTRRATLARAGWSIQVATLEPSIPLADEWECDVVVIVEGLGGKRLRGGGVPVRWADTTLVVPPLTWAYPYLASVWADVHDMDLAAAEEWVRSKASAEIGGDVRSSVLPGLAIRSEHLGILLPTVQLALLLYALAVVSELGRRCGRTQCDCLGDTSWLMTFPGRLARRLSEATMVGGPAVTAAVCTSILSGEIWLAGVVTALGVVNTGIGVALLIRARRDLRSCVLH